MAYNNKYCFTAYKSTGWLAMALLGFARVGMSFILESSLA